MYLRKLVRDLKQQKYLLVMMWPAVIWMAIFSYIPIYFVLIAFKEYNPGLGFMGSPWVGLKYFQEMIRDPYLFTSIRNTLMYSFLNLIIGFPIPIVFAVLLNELTHMNKYKRVVQTVSYLPHFLSWAFVASFLSSFLSEGGLLNRLLMSLGVLERPYAYMANSLSFVIVIVLSSIWRSFGYGSIIYLSAMTSIDQEMYEAAYIDGANRWQRIRFITLPSIKPTIAILLILNISGMINSNFEQFFLLSNTMVSEIARVIDVYTYNIGFEKGRFSYGTAVGLFKSLVSFLLLISANFASKKITGESIY